jgi:hypothetical protein
LPCFHSYNYDMAKILILGNGMSRLSFDKQIRNFTGEVWGCNRIYLDYGDKLTLLYGHQDVVREGGLYRDKNHLHYKLAGTNEFELQCNFLYRKDSGTTLAAEALTRGYGIILCGFDLGGPDVYSPGIEKQNKSIWVDRWRLIYKKFGRSKIEWWGHDHTKFILSGERRDKYFKMYVNGEPHLPEVEYQNIIKSTKTQNVLESVPVVYLHNIGKRRWQFFESDEILLDGESIILPQCVAEKYKSEYPNDFEIISVDK